MKLSQRTAKAQHFIEMWETADSTELYNVYKNYSSAKLRAFDDCRSGFNSTVDAERFRIISHNSQFFTAAWYGFSEQYRKYGLFVETYANSYFIPFVLDK